MTHEERIKVLRGSQIGKVRSTELDDGRTVHCLEVTSNRQCLNVVLNHMGYMCLLVNGYLTMNTYDHTTDVNVEVQISSS